MARKKQHIELEELQDLMQDAPDDRTRQEIQKMMTRLEQM